MLIDKNKNKVVTQAITEAAAIASRVEPGGNITCAQKHGKAVSVGAVTSASVTSQSTVGFLPSKGNGYPTHFCKYCPLSSIVLFFAAVLREVCETVLYLYHSILLLFMQTLYFYD